MAQERRVVCVVFAQALGLTELPEAERAAATDELFLRFRAVVERHGGTVDKFIGDVAMAVFGAPVARGNDEARAMRAALEMRGDTREFSARRQLALEFRAGANAGEVLWGGIGGDRATATGDVVNVARRVMEAAAPGEILATAAVEERTRRDIAWSGTEQLKLRGREQPVDVFTASRAAETGTVSTPPQGPMVGRAAESAALLAGPSAFFVVEGSAGSGKSRLLAEFRKAVRDRDPQAFVATGRAVEGAPAPLGPFADILRGAAGTPEPAAIAAWLAPALGDAPGAPDARFAADALLTSIGLVPPGSRAAELPADRAEAEGRAAWARWLRARSRDGRVVLCLEDLQEADEGTPGLMAYLAKELAGERVAIVGATRPGPAEIPGYRRLVLGDLSAPETVAIAVAALGRPVGPRLASWLREQAGGHPFYVAELARWLGASGHLAGEPAELVLPPSRTPEGLHGLLVARLDAEPEEEKEALKGASVVGRAFWVSVVNETLGREVARPIEEARARGLVTAGGPAPLAGDPELAFAHALLRDAAYALLPRRERARLHAAAAAALDAREAAAGRRAVELAARHHEAAGHPGTAARRWLHAADLAFREQSMAESLACAREAARAGGGPEAHAQAASCLMALSRFPEALEETVLAAVPEAPPEVRTRALMTRASTLERTARYAEAADAATQAYAAAPTGVLRAEAVWNQGNAFFRLDRLQEAQEAYDRAEAFLAEALAAGEPKPAAPLAARILSTRALVEFRLEHHEASVELQKRAIAAFRAAGRRRDCAVALANLAGPSRLLGDQAEASRALEEALPIAHESGDRSLEATVLHNIGVGHVDTGNYALSIEYFKRSRELRRAVGDPSGEIHSLTSEAMAHAELAQGADALRCLQDAIAIVGRVPAHEKLLIPVIEGARGYFHLLGSEAVAAVFEQARALAAPPTLLEILEMESGTFGFRGHFARGLAAISSGAAMAKEHARDRLAADFLSVRVSLLVLMGEAAAADEACREMDSLAARGGAGASWDVLMSRAQIAEHAGDRERARVRYREALNAAGIERLRVLASLPAARLELDGDPAAAIRLLEGPAAREPRGLRTQRPRLLATLAAAQAGTGRLEEAREALAAAEASRDTWASSCDDLFAREMLARAHRAVGDLEGSARLLAALLESARGLGFHGLARRVERDAAAWR